MQKKSEIFTINPYNIDKTILSKASQIIKQGGVIAFPTETVYALGADVNNIEAIKKVYKLKKRNKDKPLSMFVKSISDVKELVDKVTPEAEQLMKTFWPGPLTLVFQTSHPDLAPILSGENKLGVRVSSSPLVKALLEGSGKYISATSANISGKKSCILATQVFYFFTGRVDLILDGGKANSSYTSTVLDVSGDEVICLRKGLVSLNRIKEIIPEVQLPVEPVSPF